jgi:hypothetical protein
VAETSTAPPDDRSDDEYYYAYSESDVSEYSSEGDPVTLTPAAEFAFDILRPFDAPHRSAPPDLSPDDLNVPTAEEIGQYMLTHMVLGKTDDLPAVAAHVRNQAPGIVIACCGTAARAIAFADALSMPTLGSPDFRSIHGHGAKRPSPDDLQVQFIATSKHTLVFGGRLGFCKAMTVVSQICCPFLSTMVVVDAGFSVSLENNLSQRLAAIEMLSDKYDPSGYGNVSWEAVAHSISQMSVRALAVPDCPHELQTEMRKNLQYTSISRQLGGRDSFFVIGPVDEFVGDRSTMTHHYPDGEDETEAWPHIGQLKLKQSTVVESFVPKITVIVGGRLSRRTRDAWQRRNGNASVRASRNGIPQISRGNQWDTAYQSSRKGKRKGNGKGKVKGKSKTKSGNSR